MTFHPDKCKALSIYDFRPDFVKILPFPKQHYMLNNANIDFSECERDLVNSNLRWEDHHTKILNKPTNVRLYKTDLPFHIRY